ncbi:MAG: chromosome segregation protein SMC [Hyphomicrobiales bacterium]|nr:chromosome segregation protein SMC [Hyphomicrobiales bacterium]
MQITRLRLLGFKSFVEPTELIIGPGLTGVVGPNGCGKSNLLEGLRWVMGETSYKSMRGSGMDDVIFAGTDLRPGRNSAEVTVFLDNSRRTAPAAFNDADMLEISRRIQREAGSVYKVNGREARARDVQLLFADAATGARSQALVQQGQIGQIVSAKPQDRRRILEDAAGIAGLHGRRHEAEIRLKAAESNLERLSDVIGQLNTQLQSLRRQARQAAKYKEISADLRKAEALQHHLNWTAANASVAAEEAALMEAMRAAGQLTQAEAAALRQQAEAADQLQPLREEEAVRAAVLHRLEAERGRLESEEARAKERHAELTARLAQLQKDADREQEAIAETRDILARLAEEEERLSGQGDFDGDARAEASAAADDALASLNEAEAAAATLTQEGAELRSQRRQFEAAIAEHAQRAARFAAQAADLERQIAALGGGSAQTDELYIQIEQFAETLARLEDEAQEAEQTLAAGRAREQAARDEAAQTRLKARQLETEAATLVKILKPEDAKLWKPVVDQIRVAPGYEVALGAALGDDLDVPADEAAPVRWGRVTPGAADPALPAGAEPLSKFVSGPPELSRRLAQIGVVSRENGRALAASLTPGQRLVTREGDLWRWDGFSANADAPTAAAKRLEGRNRLEALEKDAVAARIAADQAEEAGKAARQAVLAAEAEEKRLREAVRRTQGDAARAREAASKAERAAQETNQKLAALAATAKTAAAQAAEAQAARADAEARLSAAAPIADLDARLDASRAQVFAKRSAYTAAKSALDGIDREMRQRRERLAAISAERARWANRAASAEAQTSTLAARVAEVRGELTALAELPAQVAERRNRLLTEIGKAEGERRAAADKLAAADTMLRESDRALRDIQANLGAARETRARVEARLEAAREKRADLVRLTREQLECSVEDCLALAGLEPGAKLPEPIELEQTIVKLKGERERLGGVNLRAEEEAGQIGAEYDAMEKERADLTEAIAKLRQGIASLNREGRMRLTEAFDTVNGHFQRLFKVLFGGGEAELQLIESDDPLEAGLEILARPPGKKPQVLTLLSGGEKALTALALIFAVFLTNPSPICVLDEVDAPLDDSNVDRFCAMMEEMARSTETRFLVITHHPMTMSRMHRLFGVTMQEKGVSQLVSVDLQTGIKFREAS